MATYLQSLLGEDEFNTAKKNARGMGLLQAGLAGLMASGPSLTPTSAGQALGAAGLSGLTGYQDAMSEAERQGLQGIEFQKMQQDQKADEAFKAALPQVFQNGRINYQAAQQLALAYPEKMGQVMTSLNLAKPPQAKARPTSLNKIYNSEGKEVLALVDTSSGEVIREVGAPAPPKGLSDADKNKAVESARKEFSGLAPVKEFGTQAASYGRIIASAEDPSPAGDLALIFNYMKVLDPGSAVRETEFANAENAGSVPSRIRGLYNKVLEGTRLTPEQRQDFVSRGTMIYQDAERQYSNIESQYKKFASAAGLPEDQVIPNFRYRSKPSDLPPTPNGIDKAEWPELWKNMTPAERAVFSKGK